MSNPKDISKIADEQPVPGNSKVNVLDAHFARYGHQKQRNQKEENTKSIPAPEHHAHFIERHGAKPQWTNSDDVVNTTKHHHREYQTKDHAEGQKCCQPKKRDNDSKFRLQEIKLPLWVIYLARFSLIWELILYIMTVITFSLVTYSAFFAFYEEYLWEVIYIMDFIFNCDVLLRLAVEIWRYRNQVAVLVFTVPYSMFQFILDLATIIPFHQLFIWSAGQNDLNNLSKYDYWRFNRFVRLYRSYIFFRTLQEERRANEKMVFLIRFSNYYLGFIHLTACLLMFLVNVEPLDFLLMRNRELLDNTWMKVVNEKKLGYPTEFPSQTYILAMNLATATVTTVGYGDLSATNEVEMSWCIFFMLFGAIFLNGYFTSQLTTFELETDGARFDLFFRVNEIMKYLKTVGTLPLFNAKVEEYYKYLWTYREGVYEVPFMQRLPLAFQEDLLFDICQEMFDKSFLFNGTDEALLRSVSKIVKVALYNPEMILCRKGGYANKLYYILQGECRVMSKYAPKTAAILRAGSIIGEANLFFSYPYTATIETRTCCQFLILEKEELIISMDDFRDQLCLLRSKSQAKIVKLYEMHEIYGVEPVCWVAAKTNLENPSEPKITKIRRTMRWGSGFNKEVIEDVIDDTKDCVIFDTPCYRKDIVKNHLTPYVTCSVPEIMDTEINWVKYWNAVVMVSAMSFAYIGPYCVSFGQNSELEKTMCFFMRQLGYPLSVLYILDLFVEIIAAAPVYGLYYKFWDGIQVKKYEPMFYFDILAALPLGFTSGTQSNTKILDTFFKSIKLWKVIRYLHFLDNRYPLQLFWFRLTQTILVLMYGIHFIACITYVLACPETEGLGQTCEENSWLKSYEKAWESNNPDQEAPRWLRTETLQDNAPYLYSFFYSAATLTSAGFGDFNPQTKTEMVWAIGFQLFGFYLIGYYTSTLTSALSCVVRPRLVFQQKMIAIKQFMKENHLKEVLRDRIVEYFHLQNQLRGGVTLGKGICHMMHDTPEYLRSDVLYLEVVDLLEGLPVFSKVESEVIIKMSSYMKRFLIPPNTTFLHKGEIRRVMYLIKHGSIGFYGDNLDKPLNILESSSHFGIRDLLFGEPCHFTVKSLSHVCMYSIKLHQVQEAMSQDEEFWEFVNLEKERLTESIDEMIKIYSQLVRPSAATVDVAFFTPSWTTVPERPTKSTTPALEDPNYNVNREAYLKNDDYDYLFLQVKYGKFWKMFLMRRTVHPVGTFARVWNCILSVTSFVTVIILCIETFVGFRRPGFRIFQWMLDLICILDIYIKMHWGYFNDKRHGNAIMITHSMKTALNYVLHGTFVIDVVACAPLELLLPILGWTDIFGYGDSATWYTKLRWTRALQIKRLTMVFEITHNIFSQRNAVLLLLYVVMTIFLCTLLGAIALFTACPWEASFWQKGDEYRMPVCLERREGEDAPDYWATIKSNDQDLLSSPLDRWTLSLYYVSQVVLVIGFGDLITLRHADILMLIFMSVFGFIFMRCVIADVTAAEVDSDEIRSNFLEKMQTLELVMLRQDVPKRLMKNVMEHLNYTWKRSKGLQPRDLFADLHPALESDLFRELVGKELAKVPLFFGFTANITRTICGFLKKIYFRRGERIMRCGNLEYEMCIIIKGKVYISDMHFNYLCTLSSGDCFGEASMIKGSRRCFNAVAMTNVEMYYMTANNFELVLERYPTVKSDLEKKLGGGDRDFFEQGVDEKIRMVKHLSKQQQKGLIKSFAVRRDMIKTALSLREDLGDHGISALPWYSRRRWIGYGSQDEDLPFIYFAKGRYRKRGNTFSILIHPRCSFMKIYTIILVWLSYVTSAIATYETCFIGGHGNSQNDTVSKNIVQISRGLELLYLFNLLLKFITPFEASEGVFCKTYVGIIVRYVSDPTKFLIDAIACLPVIVEQSTEESLQESDLKYIYLLKIIRLYRYYQYQFGRKDDLSISTFRYKITISVSSFCLMAHMLACVFYNISPCVPRGLELCPKGDYLTWTFVYKNEHKLETIEDFLQWKWWIRSLYWVVTVVSTTGFGDILPYSVPEMGVAVVCIFCGAFILSIILSHFTSGMASVTKSNREYMYQVQLLVKHLRNIGLSKTRQDQIMMHFLMMWKRCRGTSYSKATTILPICLQIEVCNALFKDCLSTVPYFKGYDEESFIRQLSVRVNHAIFIPGVCIVKEGDQGSSMFIVFKGIVSATKLPATASVKDYYNPDEANKPQKLDDSQLTSVYKVGDVFGRFAALYRNEAYTKSYRAESRVEVLELQQKDVEHLSKQFPFFARNMMHLINIRYDSDGPGQSIFSEVKKNKENLFDLGDEYKQVQIPKRGKKKVKEARVTKEDMKPDIIIFNENKNTKKAYQPQPQSKAYPGKAKDGRGFKKRPSPGRIIKLNIIQNVERIEKSAAVAEVTKIKSKKKKVKKDPRTSIEKPVIDEKKNKKNRPLIVEVANEKNRIPPGPYESVHAKRKKSIVKRRKSSHPASTRLIKSKRKRSSVDAEVQTGLDTVDNLNLGVGKLNSKKKMKLSIADAGVQTGASTYDNLNIRQKKRKKMPMVGTTSVAVSITEAGVQTGASTYVNLDSEQTSESLVERKKSRMKKKGKMSMAASTVESTIDPSITDMGIQTSTFTYSTLDSEQSPSERRKSKIKKKSSKNYKMKFYE